MISIRHKSDIFGATASFLCLLHCIATPFLFVAHAHASILHLDGGVPLIWQSLDYIFLIFSFLAIYWSVKNSAKEWIKFVLWGNWGLLLIIILNEKLGFVSIPENTIYIPSIALVFFHYYNLKYCKCKDDSCCTN